MSVPSDNYATLPQVRRAVILLCMAVSVLGLAVSIGFMALNSKFDSVAQRCAFAQEQLKGK